MTGLFGKLFGKTPRSSESSGAPAAPEQEEEEIPVDPLDQEKTQPLPADQPARQPLEPPQLLVGCGHSVGKQRDHNEDALFTWTTTLVSDSNSLPFGLFIVADGMGGHQHGEMASGIAVRAMAGHVVNALHASLFTLSAAVPQEPLQEIMRSGVQAAHRAIIQHTPGGGSTLTGVLILGNQMTIAHVGDSRAYLISNDGKLEVLTRDHSLVKRLVELGQITSAEAAVHPQRNVLYRALGQGEPMDAEITTAQLPPSGFLLICSDGLWGVIKEEEILHAVMTAPTLAGACQMLVESANAAGGPDNITAILVRLPDSV